MLEVALSGSVVPLLNQSAAEVIYLHDCAAVSFGVVPQVNLLEV